MAKTGIGGQEGPELGSWGGDSARLGPTPEAKP